MLTTNVLGSAEEASRSAGSKLGEYLSGKVPVLLMLSGGSSMDILNYVDLQLFGDFVTIGVLDERYAKTSDGNNYLALLETDFYKEVSKRGVAVIDSSLSEKEGRIGPLLGVIELSRRMDFEIKNWTQRYTDGIVVVTQGIGMDGHTAGIMPYPDNKLQFERLFESNSWFVGYDNEGKNDYRYRSTVTNYFLKEHVDASIFYAVGADKTEVLKNALVAGEVHKFPARVIHDMREVNVYTDIVL